MERSRLETLLVFWGSCVITVAILFVGAASGIAYYSRMRIDIDGTPFGLRIAEASSYAATGSSALLAVIYVPVALWSVARSWWSLRGEFRKGVALTRSIYRWTDSGRIEFRRRKLLAAAFVALCLVGYLCGFFWVLWALIGIAAILGGLWVKSSLPPVGLFLTSSTDASFHLFNRLQIDCAPLRIIALLRADAAASPVTHSVTAHDNWRIRGETAWRDVVDDLTSHVNAVIVDVRFDTDFVQWEVARLFFRDFHKRVIFIAEPGSVPSALHALAASGRYSPETLIQVAGEDQAVSAVKKLVGSRDVAGKGWVIPPVKLGDFA